MSNSKIPKIIKDLLGIEWNDILDRSQIFFINEQFLKYAVLPDGHIVFIDKAHKRHLAHFRFEDLFNGRIEIQLRK